MKDYNEAMQYMESVSKYGSVLGIENTRELLRRIGNPQERLHFVHVAGTNGKGSVCTYIASILKKSGLRVGRYVSPTIFTYLERIQVDGQWMAEGDFVRQLTKVAHAVEDMVSEGHPHPTPFEIETAVSFLEFVEQKCDIVVLEVGMGGRLDSTNVISHADSVVLTSISMDHMAILGDTLEKIAAEKAGIIKQENQVICTAQKSEAQSVINKVCEEKKATLTIAEEQLVRDMKFSLTGTDFEAYVMEEWIPFHTSLLSKYQIMNALTALKTAEVLSKNGYSIQRQHLIDGIKDATWEGRFSIVNTDPLVIVDGAHNEDAARMLAESVQLYFPNQPMIRVIGIFKDKDYDTILKRTVRKEDIVITVRPKGERGLDANRLATDAKRYANQVFIGENVDHALDMAEKLVADRPGILVYGSLSFLHEVYQYYEKEIKDGFRKVK